jgi:membrane-associated phospholipid phosphatase
MPAMAGEGEAAEKQSFLVLFLKKNCFLTPAALGVGLMMRTLRTALLLCAIVAPVRAETSLTPASSAELQALLQVQDRLTPAIYTTRALPRTPADTFDRLFMWNEIALETTAIDQTPPIAGESRSFGEQLGPHRTSRAMAIVHIAMFEAVNAITGKYRSYVGVPPVSGQVSADAAIARAAHDSLAWLFPAQAGRLDRLYHLDLSTMPGAPEAKLAGEALGAAAAQAIVTRRTDDGSQFPERVVGKTFTLHGGPGYWSPDPISNIQTALGATWPGVTPFVLKSASQFRAPPPPVLTDELYTSAFRQAARLGGDPLHGTRTDRSAYQTFEGVYWAYDGTPALCAPPRLYNQIARSVALQHGMNDVSDAARLFALINTAMADAAIAAFDTKYFYQFWRPITAIRSPDQGGNTDVHPNPAWYALGAPDTNAKGPNFTPPFPSYVSGHAVIGGAMFQILRHFWPDNTKFSFLSDEFNGRNTNIYGQLLPRHPLAFSSFHQAEQDNAQSRIYLGIHWSFDAVRGVTEGNQVGDWVFANAFQKK